MKAFARLYAALDATTATSSKQAAIASYLRGAPPADAAWALAFLSGRRLTRLVRSNLLRAWAIEAAGIPEWLFEECYQQVGDLAETIALLVPEQGTASSESLDWWVRERLLALRGQAEDAQRELMLRSWQELGGLERFSFLKLVTGGFRVGVSQQLVTRAVAEVSGIPEDVVAHRLMGAWEPSGEFFERLVAADMRDADRSRPYPFYLAYALEGSLAVLGVPDEWLAEWKWDGIRAQVVRRAGEVYLWSRGEELLAGRFPEVEAAARFLPDGTVIDGELLPFQDGHPLPFSSLQRRIGRKVLSRRILAEVPVVLVAYDLLEQSGLDARQAPLLERRARLERLVGSLPAGAPLRLSPPIDFSSWEALARLRATAREAFAEGVMLKRRSSAYGTGRRRGDWWKWKLDPFSVDAVLMYAQPGHGRRAGLFTDYTFGVWDGDALVPFAKAYSGLTDAEIREVDAFVRRNTLGRFGPVRTVAPELVFELAFEGIQRSSRHRSGVAVRFPRMARWRRDKAAREADTIQQVLGLLELGRPGAQAP
jgi:DNA ligase-1